MPIFNKPPFCSIFWPKIGSPELIFAHCDQKSFISPHFVPIQTIFPPSFNFKQVFCRGYKPCTINFPYHRSHIKSNNISRKLLDCDTQINTLVCSPHVYLDQSALRILCDIMPRNSRSDFAQVVVAYSNSVRALFRARYVLPVATITIACYCSIESIIRFRYNLSGAIVFPCLV